MPLPTSPTSNWMQGMDLPSRIFGDSRSDYELYEEEGEFTLSVELPGFDREEIDLAWDEGILNVAAEHVDEDRGQQKTYHRRFRFPKDIDDEAISAQYNNGVLEVTLPLREEATVRGKSIPIES